MWNEKLRSLVNYSDYLFHNSILGDFMKQHEISAMLKAEERHTSNLEPHEIGFAPLDFSAGWRACAEWRDSQVGEPVAEVTHNNTNCIGWYPKFNPLAVENGTKLYLAPSAAQINQQLVEALSELYEAIDSCIDLTPEVLRNSKSALAAAKGQA